MSKKFYAYFIPATKDSGILSTWDECKKKVTGVKANYKSFPTKEEASTWLESVIGGNIPKNPNSPSKPQKYYACFVNSSTYKIFPTWAECENFKDSHFGCRYKSFKTEAEALEWIESGANYITKKSVQANLPDGIYFDAGTGRGIGTETKVSFKDGVSILPKYFPNENINEFGNLELGFDKTNNYGELKGIDMALDIALLEGIKNIYGDSALVIDYWSKGLIKSSIAPETIELAKIVKVKREKFEKLGGSITHVSGDFNPADLGFHK